MDRSVAVAAIVGAVQGVFEWLPISSEGNVAIALAALGSSPRAAVAYALFLHLGTAVSATAYYRSELRSAAAAATRWRPGRAFEGEAATPSFLALATVTSGAVGIAAYRLAATAVSELAGGAFVAVVGGLLVLTGVLQRSADAVDVRTRAAPSAGDALLVGVLQGLAILPGVSRSGTTTSALLLRGHGGESAFRLSFLLSIPAAVGGAAIVALDASGIPAVRPTPAAVALGTAAVVGYLSIGALMRLVRRWPFWMVCVVLGGLAVAGGLGSAIV